MILNKIRCTIYDSAEGRIHVTVNALNDEDAFDEAGIHAAELGCRFVDEIVVGCHE